VQRQGCFTAAGVEHVTVDLALVDQCSDLGLGLADAPRRPHAGTESGGIAAVGGFELEVLWCGHERCIDLPPE
jgi:hypothetical protein